MAEPITWQQKPQYRQVITKQELLRDIKDNLKALLEDYKGRGIENEAFYAAQVEKMFTGGVVPSLTDWKILNLVLEELSEVKEAGEMYRHFIADVSDSLGVSDLEKIRDFIHYISILGPDTPEVEMSVDVLPRYSISNLRATFQYPINQPNKSNMATTYWDVQEPQTTPYVRIMLHDAQREDINEYRVTFRAGNYKQTFTYDGMSMESNRYASISIPLNWKDWFGVDAKDLDFHVTVVTADKRGNESTTTKSIHYPPSKGIPVGFETFQLQYLSNPNKNWAYPNGPNTSGVIQRGDRSYGPLYVLDVDGRHQYRVRGYDPGVGWSEWVYSPGYNLTFRGDPPGKPAPKVTTTHNSATVTWKATSNTDYYNVFIWWGRDHLRRVNAGSKLETTFTGLSQNRSYNFYVEAVNEWDATIGQVTGVTKRIVNKTISWNAKRHVSWNGQSYYNNRTGYRTRHSYRNNSTDDKPHWRSTYNCNSGSLYQGHWRETSWGLGYAMRSGGYRAWDGQSHGNNATFIEMDYNGIRNRLRGKKITKVEIRLRREGSSHGWANKGQPVYLYNHNSTFRPGDPLAIYTWNRSKVSRSNNPATASLNFSRGAEHVFSNNNTKKLMQNIVDGHMRGFAFIKYYGTSFDNSTNVPRGSTHYIRFRPSRFNVKVHYQDIV